MELTLDQALIKGVEAHKAGKLVEADRYYTAILKAQPKHPDANHNMGVLAVGLGKLQESLPFFKTALETNPSIAQFWLSYIDALIKLNRIADAKVVFEEAKSKGVKGNSFEQIEKRLIGLEKNLEVNATFRKLQDPPKHKLQNLINLYSQGLLHKALTEGSQLLKDFPDSVNIYSIIGAVNIGLGKLDEAIEAYNKIIFLQPDYVQTYNNIGIALQNQGKLEEAIEAYIKALSLKPDYAEAYNNMGVTLQDQGKLEESIEAYKKALSLNLDYAEAYNNMGNTLKDLGKIDEAIEVYSKALSIKPQYAEALYNLGISLIEKGKLDEAIETYKKALSIKPDYAEAYNNMGNALKDLGKIDQAIEVYSKALSIKPDYGTAKHMLCALTGNTNETAPREFVENLFDGYAKKFETSLVDKLQYKIPKIIRDILIKQNDNTTLGSVLDLGCGTGLLGSEIKNHCSKLEGIDLSNKMLAIANQKNVYNKLTQIDIVEYLSSMPLGFDYYIALDVFIYVGKLTEIFRLVKSRNKKPGYLVFSTEHTEKDGYHLLKTGRYSHSKSYIESLCKKFNYNITHFSTNDLRKEKSTFIKGGIYVLCFKP